MREHHRTWRRLAVGLAAATMAFALSAAGCSTSGRDLPAPTTTAGAAFVTPSSITPTIPPTTTR